MLELKSQIDELEKNGIEMLHIDILDGRFSPSMPLGFETVRQLRKYINMEFDCHVMTENPEYYVDELIDIGVQQITFHIETADHVDGLLNRIHSYGIRAGVALKPSTPVCELEYIIEKCDVVLLMLINPGYASNKEEKQVIYAKRKINDLKRLIEQYDVNTLIEIDGRISINNIQEFSKQGVNIFVCGTTCLDSGNISYSINNIKKQLLF
jgi:Pentose-5-phosphate-3-epimerase